MPVSWGRLLSNSVNASRPPAEAPTPTTMGSELPSAGSSAVGRTSAAAETGVTDAVEVFPAGGVRRLGRGASGARRERTNPPGRRLPVLFTTRHHYLSRRNERASITGTTARTNRARGAPL